MDVSIHLQYDVSSVVIHGTLLVTIFNSQNHASVLSPFSDSATSTDDHLTLDPESIITPCPNDYTWSPKLQSCYKLVSRRVPWREARERCLTSGGDLVAIESDREQRFLNRLATEESSKYGFGVWINGTMRGKDNGN